MSKPKYADQWDRWWEQKRDVIVRVGPHRGIYFVTLNPLWRYVARPAPRPPRES